MPSIIIIVNGFEYTPDRHTCEHISFVSCSKSLTFYVEWQQTIYDLMRIGF